MWDNCMETEGMSREVPFFPFLLQQKNQDHRSGYVQSEFLKVLVYEIV